MRYVPIKWLFSPNKSPINPTNVLILTTYNNLSLLFVYATICNTHYTYIYIYILWTVDGKIPEPPWTVEPYNGINHLPTGEGFLPSTVCTHIYIYHIHHITSPKKSTHKPPPAPTHLRQAALCAQVPTHLAKSLRGTVQQAGDETGLEEWRRMERELKKWIDIWN